MTKTIFIAFAHRKRVGKSSASKFLCSYLRFKRHGSNIQTAAFADKLKLLCYELFSWAGLQPGSYYDDEEHQHEKEIILPLVKKSPRTLWIEVGNKMREVYPMIWIDSLIQSPRLQGCDVCILTDLRYPNEAEAVQASSGFVYKIDRKDAPDTSDIADDALNDYTDWNGVIENNGTLKEFNKKIEELGANLLLQLPKKE